MTASRFWLIASTPGAYFPGGHRLIQAWSHGGTAASKARIRKVIPPRLEGYFSTRYRNVLVEFGTIS